VDGDADVIVLGAGIVGLSAARALAAEGARVLVIERGGIGEEASAAAAGMLLAQADTEATFPLLDLALLARNRHAALAAELEKETGICVERSAHGVLEVAFSEAEEAALDARYAWQRERGLSVEALGGAAILDAEPNVNPAVRAGLFFADDRSVDNVRLVRALAASAVSRGAVLLSGRPASRLIVDGRGMAGVEAGAERFGTRVVVNATGAWAGLMLGDLQPPPVEPVRGHIVAFDMPPGLVRRVVCSHRGYLVPRRDGRVLAGSTVERVGFDKSVTAGALHAILAIALEIAPRLAEAPIAESWAGLRPGTPDGLPIVGKGAVPGLVHATGLYRNGILLGPLIGEAAARLAQGRDPGIDLRGFAPDRFHG